MNNPVLESFFSIFLAIVGIAFVAILISKKSNTAGVLQAFGSAFSNSLGTAISPVTGSSMSINTSYPSSFGLGF